MTISDRVLVAEDVFVDNEVFLLSRAEYPNIPSLGGIAWLRQEPPASAHLNALTTAAATVARAFPTHSLRLLGGHTAPQPSSAIARHRRLWKSLEARGVRVPTGTRTKEVAVADQGGTRWFGAISISRPELTEAANVVEAEPASLVVAVPADVGATVEDLLSTGWASPNQGPPPKIIDWLTSNAGIAFWTVGGFDDVESGVVAFGTPENVERLANASS